LIRKTTAPTVGFNVETFQYKNVKFNMWDVGGQDRLRPLWRHYYPKTNALIYVIDSCDRSRLQESKQQLYKVMNELNNTITGTSTTTGTSGTSSNFLLLIFANKQDLKNSIKPKEINEFLELDKKLNKNQLYAVIGTNALTGQGLIEGLSWISNNFESTKV